MVIFHVHKSGVWIRFAVIIPPLKTGGIPVIDRLTLQEAAEQFLIPLVPAFAFPSSMYKKRPFRSALFLQKPADFL